MPRISSSLAANKRTWKPLKRKPKAFQSLADVLDQKATNEMFATITKDMGLIDVLVSNAGYLANLSTVKDASIDDFWNGFEVNVKAATILTQTFLKSAAEDVILIDINAAMAHNSFPGPFASYAASKIAFIRVLDYVRMENPQLRVYSIHPGVVKTDIAVKAGITNVPWDEGRPSSSQPNG